MRAAPVLAAGLCSWLVLSPQGGAARPPASTCGDAPPPSIHQLELQAWRARERDGWLPWSDPPGPPSAPPGQAVPAARLPRREVLGFHPYWRGGAYLGYDWSLISSVAFFALELDADGAIADAHGWPWAGLVAAAHAGGARALATAALFDPARLDLLLVDPGRRAAAAGALVAAVLAGGADGICLDFEGVPRARRDDLVAFAGELRAALRAASPGAYLAIATPAVDWLGAYDYDELAARCDHLLAMAYGYRWPGSATTGPVAPLQGWGTHNVAWTVEDHLRWGTPPGKLLLGVPYYGCRWPAASAQPGAATLGTGQALTYAEAAAAVQAHGRLWDATGWTPWSRWQEGTWRQLWYDDQESLAAKYALVLAEGLAGVGVWALGYDSGRPELWAALSAAFEPVTALEDETAGGVRGGGVHGGEQVEAALGGAARPSLAAAGTPGRGARLRVTLPQPAHIQLSIHDLRGRKLAEVAAGSRAAGRHEVIWDGRDPQGRRLAAGTYLARLWADGRTAAAKLSLGD